MCSTDHIYQRWGASAKVGVLFNETDPIFLCGECPWTSDDVDEFVEHRKWHHPARFAPPPDPPTAGTPAAPPATST
ncbi:hypothetical protein GGI24_002094, partial [Coemansia furcata]